MRTLSESTGMSLGEILKDASLLYDRDVEASYA
jgi:hypothetical protein